MHHADRQGAHRPALRMRMAMRRSGVRAFAAVAVRMDMREAQSVAVDMEVGAVAHQPAQHVGAEQHQHDPDGRLQRLPEARGNRLAQPEHDAAEEHQRQGVADAPGHALAQGLRQRALPRRQGGDGGEVVHLGSVLHAEEQADDQDRERGHAGTASFPSAMRCPSHAYQAAIPSPVSAETRSTSIAGLTSRA